MINIIRLDKALLQKSHKSLCETYDALVPSSETYDTDTLIRLFEKIDQQGTNIFVAVKQGENGETIIGVISLLIEYKLIRGGVIAGHIEDISVHPDAQGQGLGSKLMNYALTKAKKLGCYKVILDCEEKYESYYEKFGFEKSGTFMRRYNKLK